MTGAEAVQQVLVRLLERNNSPVAQLAAGTGPSAVTITTADQILKFLNDGQNLLCRTSLLELRGTATVAVTSSTRSVKMSAMTSTPASRTPWAVRSATWTQSAVVYPLKVAGTEFYDVYFPAGTETTRPTYVFDGASYVLLGALPNANGTLDINCLLLGSAITSGSAIADVPDVLLVHLFEYACWQVALMNAQNEAFAAVVPFWRDATLAWAGGVLGMAPSGGA